MSDLLVSYVGNGTGHKDIFFRLGEYVCVADSYYLVLDNEMNDPTGITEDALVRLLEQWLQAIERANSESPIFLPYDFSDQFTRCLRCVSENETIEFNLAGHIVRAIPFLPAI